MTTKIDKVKPRKKPQAIHCTKLTDKGDFIVEIATPIAEKDDRKLQVEDYQITTINLGKIQEINK